MSAYQKELAETWECPENKARSITICCASNGTIISIFRHGGQKRTFSWATITVTKDMDGCEGGSSFQCNGSHDKDSLLSFNYYEDSYKSALDGHVSSFRIDHEYKGTTNICL